ncbi:MAG: hypothetical protein IT159_02140 [Bryobacterales bacterium]|nr:hypothetical protein [Bryobacterales bacterium]
MRSVALIAAAALCMTATAGQPPPEAARVERLAALGKLWAAVKYFHPSLAYKDIDWDAALLQTLPKISAATSAAEYAQAVQSMLSWLGDPATRVLPAPGAEPANSALIERAPGGVLVVRINPGTAAGGEVARLRSEIAQARGVVFDLRNQQAWTGSRTSAVGLLFVEAGLNNLLADGVLNVPGQRFRIHSGLASPWEGGSVYFHSAFYVRDGAQVKGDGAGAARTVVFLADRTSHLPPIAPALQTAGRARIVAAGGVTDTALVERNLIRLPDNIEVELRTTELVYEDGTTGLVPDLVAPEEGNRPLEAALRLARDPGSVRPAARPKLPPYAVPRREEAYASAEFPSREHRLLAAFRIWAAFEYFFAYRRLMEDDWDGVLAESLPRFEEAANAGEYALAVAAMLSHTQDSHVGLSGSRAFDQFLGVARPPVETRLVEGLPVVTYAAEGTGVSPGDVIERVDGEAARVRFERLGRYFAASTPQSLADVLMLRWLGGPAGSVAVLGVRGADGSDREVRLERTETLRRRTRPGDAVRVLPGNIGYADLERIAPAEVDPMFQKLKDTRAIIFDMRGYPQGTAWLIAPRLTDRSRVVAARFRRPLAYAPPGASGDVATLGASWDFVQYIPDSSAEKYRGRTVMLIDERAMSQAEHMGLFLKAANGTTFIGTPTAGANGDVARFTIPGGITISFSGHDIRHPDGRQLQRAGLQPDIEARPTIAGIRSGRDEVLERALEYLR